jgi:hypothetical protein
VAYHQGEIEHARDLIRQALAIRWEFRDIAGVAATLVAMASVAAEEGQPASIRRAARWLGSLSAGLDSIRVPLLAPDRREFEMVLARVHAQLGETDLQRALEAGRQMTLEQAVADALGSSPLKTAE